MSAPRPAIAAACAFALLTIAACTRTKAPAGAPDADAPSAVRAAPLPDATERARRATQAWSDALDRHDVPALEAMYDARVRFYGRDLAKGDVIAAKRAALGPTSSFRQSIVGPIAAEQAADGVLVTRFRKRSGPASGPRETAGELRFRAAPDGALVIVDEADAPSEVHATSGAVDCEATAARVVAELPPVARAIADAKKSASAGGGHFGGQGPERDESGGFSASLGVFTSDRFDSTVDYTVDRAGGLHVTVVGADVAVPERALREVARACAR